MSGATHASESQSPPQRGVEVVMRMIASMGRIERERPDAAAESLIELSHAMSTAAKAIRRGFITGCQLSDMGRRASILEAKVTG